ncbi:MAG: FKBP-type peptidyl-prolyl cis-trans isomerase [Actinomycetota bacterium]|nr:FKBP-type peptidyl-prolyl cis-trans isomerase [Actinomycetota bacterium]
MRRSAPILLCLSLLAAVSACGDSDPKSDGGDGSTPVSGECGAVGTVYTKPEVTTPSATPTELVITDLTTGACSSPAVEGDTVVVHYVGVRSEDGTEFDNSYDRGETFEVQLGAGGVIPGWDQGLVGVQQGGRRQLDIPAELAYGDAGSGDVIQPGDALSFVVDVVAVLPGSKATDDPGIEIEGTDNVDELVADELLQGAGAVPQDGQMVAVRIVTYRADTGEQLASSWGEPAFTFLYSPDSDVWPGLLDAVEGMKVGGRRQAQIPFASMFDGAGNEGLGLPASVDLTVVLDLVAIY